MGSRRLPGKSMLSFWRGMPVIELVLRRVSAAQSLSRVVLVTSEHPRDAELAEAAIGLGLDVFRGPENDVLSRFAGAFEVSPAAAVVRICADNPFVEPRAIDELVRFFIANQPCDYASNADACSGLPDGIGAEVLGAQALLDAAREAETRSEREHVPEFLLKRPGRFSIRHVPAPHPRLPRVKLDIDTRADYDAMCALARELPVEGAPLWGRDEVLEAWKRTAAQR